MTINDEDCSDTQIITIDILNYITLIINQSLTSYIYLDSLKVANVTPIYKKKYIYYYKLQTNFSITCHF